MSSVGIFFGSDTGNTEHVAKMIQKELGKKLVAVHDIAKSSKEEIAEFDLLLFGIPTWYYGEAQCDWDDFFPELEGMINDIVTERGAIVVGHWSTEGYDFEASKALVDDSNFVGLGIDEDRQPELTEKRVKDWCAQVYDEMCLAELAD